MNEHERFVDQETIRRAFNVGNFLEKLRAGELRARIHENSIHLSRRLAKARDEPRCTRSQIVSYYDGTGLRVAVIHQYRRRDGSLGGSGLPDPKWLRVTNEILLLDD
jgi:hypothetical protein